MGSFGLALESGKSLSMKIGSLVEDTDSLFFVADDEKRLQPIHSPRT